MLIFAIREAAKTKFFFSGRTTKRAGGKAKPLREKKSKLEKNDFRKKRMSTMLKGEGALMVGPTNFFLLLLCGFEMPPRS